jgi:hypothetical protein
MSDLAKQTQMRIEEKTKNLSKIRHQDINKSNLIEKAKEKVVFDHYVIFTV